MNGTVTVALKVLNTLYVFWSFNPALEVEVSTGLSPYSISGPGSPVGQNDQFVGTRRVDCPTMASALLYGYCLSVKNPASSTPVFNQLVIGISSLVLTLYCLYLVDDALYMASSVL